MVRRVAALLAFVSCALACTKKEAPPAPSAPPDASVPAAKPSRDDAVRLDGKKLVEGACLSCHTDEMLVQQRLTHAQWTKVVTKMSGWGANLELADKERLVTYLAEEYGPDAGPFEPPVVTVSSAAGDLEPTDDGPLANGDAEHGRALYTDRCSGCHGAEARGHIGVLLVDRPFLRRAADFANVVRRGRGKMPPAAITDRELADVLAHLRRLPSTHP